MFIAGCLGASRGGGRGVAVADIDHNRSRELELEYGIGWADRLQQDPSHGDDGRCLEHTHVVNKIDKLSGAMVCMAYCETMPAGPTKDRWHCWLEIDGYAIDLTKKFQRFFDRDDYRERAQAVQVYCFNNIQVLRNQTQCGVLDFWPLTHPEIMEHTPDA